MNDALLNFGIWINGFYSLREAFKAIDTGDQDIRDTAVLQVCEYAKPVMGALGIGKIQAQQLLLALDVEG